MIGVADGRGKGVGVRTGCVCGIVFVTITLDGVGIGCINVDCAKPLTVEITRTVKLKRTYFFIVMVATERQFGVQFLSELIADCYKILLNHRRLSTIFEIFIAPISKHYGNCWIVKMSSVMYKLHF